MTNENVELQQDQEKDCYYRDLQVELENGASMALELMVANSLDKGLSLGDSIRAIQNVVVDLEKAFLVEASNQ